MENTTETEHMTQVSFRIPKSLKEMIEKFVAQDCHVNPSDFFREALREKIRAEAPELHAQLFKPEVKRRNKLERARCSS